MNRLREIFDPDSEYNKELTHQAKQLEEEAIKDKCCRYCINSINEPYYEHGKYGGTNPFCQIFDKLILEYGYGQQCLFWNDGTKERVDDKI